MNRRGPSIEPWGTPLEKVELSLEINFYLLCYEIYWPQEGHASDVQMRLQIKEL